VFFFVQKQKVKSVKKIAKQANLRTSASVEKLSLFFLQSG
jgi:hypothetical protein